jgi:uncharacterized protein YggE
MKSLSLFLSVFLLISCNPGNDYKTILLKTSGFVEIAPDEASIILDANCVDMNIKQAKDCLIDITSKLNDELTSFGIQKVDILTTNVNLSKDYIWTNNSEVFNGYRASTTTRVKVRDLKILDELYSKLLSNEKLTIGSLSYGHSKMDSITGVASLKALENANKLADQILSQLPEKSKIITQISNFEISKSEAQTERNAKMLEVTEQALDKSSITVNIGNIMAVQNLYVEFKIY